MKQTTIFILALSMALSISSCKKKYVCSCVITQNYGGYNQTATESHTIKAKNRVDAEVQCNTYVNNSSYQSVSCSIQ